MSQRLVLFAAIIALVHTNAIAQEILVVTDQHHPVFSVPSQARVIELDKVSHIEASLSDGLNQDQEPSATLARSRLNHDTHRELASAYQGVVDAWSLGVQKIPAVIIDRQYVIYGEPDIQKAVTRIQAYRKERP